MHAHACMQVYAYLDGMCRVTSALLPSLQLRAANGKGGGGEAGGDRRSAQHGSEAMPRARLRTSAYGFRGGGELSWHAYITAQKHVHLACPCSEGRNGSVCVCARAAT